MEGVGAEGSGWIWRWDGGVEEVEVKKGLEEEEHLRTDPAREIAGYKT